MNGENQIVRDMRESGYVTTQEACRMTGRASNGHAFDYFKTFGVRSVLINRGAKGQSRNMFFKKDIERLVKMDSETAKAELILNHFTHSLQRLCGHFTAAGDFEALMDIRRLVDAAVDDALIRCQPVRLERYVERAN
jgi:hypothetical protein